MELKKSLKTAPPPAGSVVASIATERALAEAAQFAGDGIDFFEIRLDPFADGLESLRAPLATLRRPLIVTARCPDEGGLASWSDETRDEALLSFLPLAAWVDVEVADSARRLPRILAAAPAAGVGLIASHHNFTGPTPDETLRGLMAEAHDLGAAIFKAAITLHRPLDLLPLLRLLDGENPLALSLMGMGPWGKISRLLLAQAGSVLNYTHLGPALASGQWPAELFARRLAEIQAPT